MISTARAREIAAELSAYERSELRRVGFRSEAGRPSVLLPKVSAVLERRGLVEPVGVNSRDQTRWETTTDGLHVVVEVDKPAEPEPAPAPQIELFAADLTSSAE